MKGFLLFLLMASPVSGVLAQPFTGADAQPLTNGAENPLEFQIPVSAAFDLLGVNPSSVMRPGNIRDFKVDWSFQSYRLRPNLAIQAQPIWELFYNRTSLQRYQKAPRWLKMLSTLDLSAGTVEQQVGENRFDRRLAIAGKMTVWRSKDPLDDADLYREVTDQYLRQRTDLLTVRQTLADSLSRTPATGASLALRQQLSTQLTDAERQLDDLDRRQKARIAELSAQFVRQHWNASFLDIAYGRAYTFDNPLLDSLRLTQDGWSVWANGSFGIGRRVLVSGLVRYTEFTSELSRLNRFSQQYIVGFNLRYGSPKFNFFAEVLNQTSRQTRRADQVTIAYGGDWRFSRNVMLSYAVRTIYNRSFVFKNLVPIVSLSCMMR